MEFKKLLVSSAVLAGVIGVSTATNTDTVSADTIINGTGSEVVLPDNGVDNNFGVDQKPEYDNGIVEGPSTPGASDGIDENFGVDQKPEYDNGIVVGPSTPGANDGIDENFGVDHKPSVDPEFGQGEPDKPVLDPWFGQGEPSREPLDPNFGQGEPENKPDKNPNETPGEPGTPSEPGKTPSEKPGEEPNKKPDQNQNTSDNNKPSKDNTADNKDNATNDTTKPGTSDIKDTVVAPVIDGSFDQVKADKAPVYTDLANTDAKETVKKVAAAATTTDEAGLPQTGVEDAAKISAAGAALIAAASLMGYSVFSKKRKNS